MPLRKRKVNSLDAALEQKNYKLRDAVPVTKQKIISGIVERGRKRKRLGDIPDKRLYWTNVTPTVNGRHGAQDIVDNKPGLTSMSKVSFEMLF